MDIKIMEYIEYHGIRRKRGMLRKMMRIFALIGAVCLATALPALAEAEDPVVVRVEDVTFTKSQLQSSVETDIRLIETLGQSYMTEEEQRAQRDDTIDRFIGVGLIECKLRDVGPEVLQDMPRYGGVDGGCEGGGPLPAHPHQRAGRDH